MIVRSVTAMSSTAKPAPSRRSTIGSGSHHVKRRPGKSSSFAETCSKTPPSWWRNSARASVPPTGRTRWRSARASGRRAAGTCWRHFHAHTPPNAPARNGRASRSCRTTGTVGCGRPRLATHGHRHVRRHERAAEEVEVQARSAAEVETVDPGSDRDDEAFAAFRVVRLAAPAVLGGDGLVDGDGRPRQPPSVTSCPRRRPRRRPRHRRRSRRHPRWRTTAGENAVAVAREKSSAKDPRDPIESMRSKPSPKRSPPPPCRP